MTPAEIGGSNYGNLLVRDRLKSVIECVAPGQCRLYPTTYLGTNQTTPWSLLVPTDFCCTGKVIPKIARCSTCGEPFSAHPGTEYLDSRRSHDWLYPFIDPPDSMPSEFYLTSNWASAETPYGHKQWVHRDVYVSLRFGWLMRELKVTGVYLSYPNTKPTAEEMGWVREQITRLKAAGIPLTAPGVLNGDTKKWFKTYLKENAGSGVDISNVRTLEKTHKLRFSKSYLEFAEKVGRARFQDAGSEAGMDVDVLPPQECDFATYRKGKLEVEDEDSREVDGIMFASTECGDCFCFDYQKDKKESEVFVYRHEYNCFETYAANFVECLRKFIAGSEGKGTEE